MLDHRERTGSVARLEHAEAAATENPGRDLPHRRLVVNHEDGCPRSGHVPARHVVPHDAPPCPPPQ